MEQKQSASLSKLFLIFFRVGAFTFGGGYAMLSILQRELVDNMGWLTEEDFLDMIGLTQSAPGIIAINSSIYLGYRLAGIKGSLAAVAGATLPSLLIIMAIAWTLGRYSLDLLNHAFAGVRPTVTTLIAFAAWNMGKKVLKTPQAIALMVVAAALILFFNVHAAILILGGALWGILVHNRASKGEAVS